MANKVEQFGPDPSIAESGILREMFQESRKYSAEFYKHCFLVSAGALTLSAGLLLRGDPPVITVELYKVLKLAWGLLTISLLGVVVAFGFLMFCLGRLGEQAQEILMGVRKTAPEHGWMNRVGHVLDGIVAVSLVMGVVTLAYFALALVKVTG